MGLFVKNGVVESASKIIVKINGYQIINPTEEMLLSQGWTRYDGLQHSSIEELKAQKIVDINEHDSSLSINEFFVNGVSMWLDKATRAGLMLRFQAENAKGLEYTTLWYEGIQFALPLNMAMQMLYALEIYASNCYDNTQNHIANVKSLSVKEDVVNYDYTKYYPEKLVFNI